jgi:hypothetical protein
VGPRLGRLHKRKILQITPQIASLLEGFAPRNCLARISALKSFNAEHFHFQFEHWPCDSTVSRSLLVAGFHATFLASNWRSQTRHHVTTWTKGSPETRETWASNRLNLASQAKDGPARIAVVWPHGLHGGLFCRIPMICGHCGHFIGPKFQVFFLTMDTQNGQRHVNGDKW